MEEQKREFRGVWIPKEIYLSKELSWTEKILFVEIDSLDNEDGCYSRNDYFAKFLGVSETHVSRMISKLKSMGLIRVESFDGRTRILHSNLKLSKADYAKMSKQDTQECQSRLCKNVKQSNPVNNIYNNIEDKDAQTTLMERFEIFYKAYPRHKSRGDAEKAWKSLKPDDTLFAKIMKALETAKKDPNWQKENHRYVPYPASWLRAKGWEDEPDANSGDSESHTDGKKGWGGYLC